MGTIYIDGHSYKSLTKKYESEPVSFFINQRVFAEEYRLTRDNQLPNTLFWNYLEVRRSLDHHRFDHYHPLIGHWIQEAECYSFTCPPPVPPPVVETGIPEPSSFVLFLTAIIAIGFFRFTSKHLGIHRVPWFPWRCNSRD